MKKMSKSLAETEILAEIFLKKLKPGKQATIVALEGDLGSGKTAFTQVVAKILGIESKITSPTFVIEKKYRIPAKNSAQNATFSSYEQLIHIDAYRLNQGGDLLSLGWAKIVKNPKNLVFLEWPKIVSGILPSGCRVVSLKFVDERTREISFD